MKTSILITISISMLLYTNSISAEEASSTEEPEGQDQEVQGAEGQGQEGQVAEGHAEEPGVEGQGEDLIPPALACVVLGDVACNRMCTMLGRIYAAPSNPAKCDADNNCECTMVQHKYLDDLWRDKFTSDELLKTIETDEMRYRDIVKVMKIPYQTREQTKSMLQWYLGSSDFAKIQVNDNVTENMVKTTENQKQVLDHDTIRSFVSQNLRSDPLAMPSDFDYKTKFRTSLENTSNVELLQYIIHDVRRSKNPVLNEIIDEFLKERQIKEESFIDDEDDETFADVLDLDIVNEYINPTPTPSTNDPTTVDSASGPWDLPDLDVASVKEFDKGYKCWTNDKDYNVCVLKPDWGDIINLDWRKGDNKINIHVDLETGEVSQTWIFGNGVEITLYKNTKGALDQIWKFSPDSQFELKKTAEEQVTAEWLHDKNNDQALAEYTMIIDSWCEKNYMFMKKEYCIIY